MTSNLGSDYILNKEINANKLVMDELRHSFKPEFINRIDEIIIFNSLNKDVLYDILKNMIKNIETRLSDKQIKLNITDKALNYIVNTSYDEIYGARPMKRYVSKTIESMIANDIILDKINTGSTITIDLIDNHLRILKG